MRFGNLLPAALVSAGLVVSGVASAQVQELQRIFDDPSEMSRCATSEPTSTEMAEVGAMLKARERELGLLAVGGQIKVAWHVIYSGSTGNIPQSQIDAQIAELNKAYSGFYGGVNTGYTFVLASVSRTNNNRWFACTPGTSRETQMKNALATDVTHRLNVYTCKPGQNLLGWSYFPNSYAE